MTQTLSSLPNYKYVKTCRNDSIPTDHSVESRIKLKSDGTMAHRKSVQFTSPAVFWNIAALSTSPYSEITRLQYLSHLTICPEKQPACNPHTHTTSRSKQASATSSPTVSSQSCSCHGPHTPQEGFLIRRCRVSLRRGRVPTSSKCTPVIHLLEQSADASELICYLVEA